MEEIFTMCFYVKYLKSDTNFISSPLLPLAKESMMTAWSTEFINGKELFFSTSKVLNYKRKTKIWQYLQTETGLPYIWGQKYFQIKLQSNT